MNEQQRLIQLQEARLQEENIEEENKENEEEIEGNKKTQKKFKINSAEWIMMFLIAGFADVVDWLVVGFIPIIGDVLDFIMFGIIGVWVLSIVFRKIKTDD